MEKELLISSLQQPSISLFRKSKASARAKSGLMKVMNDDISETSDEGYSFDDGKNSSKS